MEDFSGADLIKNKNIERFELNPTLSDQSNNDKLELILNQQPQIDV